MKRRRGIVIVTPFNELGERRRCDNIWMGNSFEQQLDRAVGGGQGSLRILFDSSVTGREIRSRGRD